MQKFIEALIKIVGTSSVISNLAAKKSYETDWRKRFSGLSIAIVFPQSTQEVVQIIHLCAKNNISVIPQGGNTSLCGGATPIQDNYQSQIIINLSQMNQILGLDTCNHSIMVEAGCTLQQVINHADKYNLYFPLHIASEGSCQIGGNIATNAGGIHVIKYGTMRNLVLGLEVVLPDGSIINQLHQLRKNNTNFDLKQLFIGSEGTLGIITKAVLSLYPKPFAFYTGLIGTKTITQAIIILNHLKTSFNLCAFEIINKNTQDLYNDVFKENIIPSADESDEWLILFEIEIFSLNQQIKCINEPSNQYKQYKELINQDLLYILQKQQINLNKVIIANSIKERTMLWQIREQIPLAEKMTGIAIKHDIALPINKIDDFIKINTQNLNLLPKLINLDHKLIIFGHLGDGNLHYNIQFFTHQIHIISELEYEINQLVYNDLIKFNGTFSAEHGIGQLKTTWYKKYCDPAAYTTTKSIKQLLDPSCLFNPHKIFP